MNSEEALAEVAAVIRKTFNAGEIPISRQTSAMDIKGWDSLSHTILMLELEQHFQVRLPRGRIYGLKNVGDLAELIADLTTAKEAANKPTLIIYANCQGGWLLDKLGSIPGINEKYSLVYIPNFDAPSYRDQEFGTEVYKNCSLLLHQVASYIPELPFEELLPSTCRRYKFPVLWMKLLWPLNAKDPRNQPTPEFPFGTFPYGDRLVIELLNKGLSSQQVYQEYLDTDLKKMIQLDRWYDICMDELRAVDSVADMQLVGEIEQTLTDKRLFVSIDHSTDYLMDRIVQRVVEFDFGASVATIPLPSSNGEGMGDEEVPIHPTLIDHFQLKWATKDMKYHYKGHDFTFDEYLRHYIDYDLPPLDQPATDVQPERDIQPNAPVQQE